MRIHPKCPHCGSLETVRSHRRFVERILMVVRPYRCDFCSRRFVVFSIERKPKYKPSNLE